MRRAVLLLLPLLLAVAVLTGMWRQLEPVGAASGPPGRKAQGAAVNETPAVRGPLTDRLAFMGHVGGPAGGVAIDGARAVATFGPVFATLDLAAGADIPRLGSLPLAAVAPAVWLDGSYAYVGTLGAGVVVLDVGDPARPKAIAARLSPLSIHDVALHHDVLLAAAGADGLYLLNVADPTQPLALGVTLNDADIRAVGAGQSYAYAVTSAGELVVIDVTIPQAPALLGSVIVGPVGGGVAVLGTRAYVSWSDCSGSTCTAHLSVINVAAPGNPQVVTSRLLGAGRAGRVALSGGYAYVVRSTAGGHQAPGVDILDVSIVDFPIVVQNVDVAGAYGASDVAVQGTVALVAYEGAGVRRYGVSDPTAPQPSGAAAGPADVQAIQSWGGGWLVGAGDGVARGELWQVTADGEPTFLAALAGMPQVTGIGADGGRVALAGGGRVQIADLTTPTAPLLQGFWEGDISQGIALAGDTAVAAGADAVRLIDVALPLTPTQVGTWPTTGPVAVADSLLAVAAGSAGLQLVDISDAAAPLGVGVFDPAWPVLDVAFHGATAVVAAGDAGLYLIDVSDPAQPALLGGIDPDWPVPAVRVYDGFALIPAGVQGVYVVDLADPAAPVEAGRYGDGRAYHRGGGGGDRVVAGGAAEGLFLLTQRYAVAGAVRQANRLPWSGALLTGGAGLVTDSGSDGAYRFTDVSSGTYTVTVAMPGYVFTPSSRVLTVPPNRSALDFVVLPPPQVFSVGAAGATLVFTDTQGVTTTFSVPPAAVGDSIAVTITPTVVADGGGYRFAGHGFDLGPAALTFDRPVTVTIDYTPADVGGIVEGEMALRRWDGESWEPARGYLRAAWFRHGGRRSLSSGHMRRRSICPLWPSPAMVITGAPHFTVAAW